MERSINLLERRIAELDKVPYVGGVVPDGDTRNLPLAHFVWVMENATEPFMKFEAGKGAVINPAMADEMVKNCRLLDAIAEYDASLIAGPLRADRQHWIYIADDDGMSDSVSTRPYPECFAMPSAATERAPAIKLQSVGLYTSTATSVGRSMWREYLEGLRGSTLFPLPWYIWELQLPSHGVDIMEITSASKWVQFIESYPLMHDAHIYPNWARVAGVFDAVHITLPAIAAAQGFHFATPAGSILPAFWDVETTFWLKMVLHRSTTYRDCRYAVSCWA